VHELVETAGGADDPRARAEVQMVLLSKDLRAPVSATCCVWFFDRRLRADRHEDRRTDLPVGFRTPRRAAVVVSVLSRVNTSD
jgi:hypothetical protein